MRDDPLVAHRHSSTHASAYLHLRRLTSLRAFAALLVLGFHLDQFGGTTGAARGFFRFGYTGVAFFFVLSGFVLTWSFRPGGGTAAFYLRRFARIWPSHFFMLLVAVAVPYTVVPVTLHDAGVNALLLQAWAPPLISPFSLNAVSWSLSCEVAFYLVLPFILPFLRRLPAWQRWALALGYWSGASIVVLASAALHHAQLTAYLWPPLRFGEFLIGVAAALETQRGWRLGKRGAAALALVGIALVAAGPHSQPGPNVGAAVVAFALVVYCAHRDLTPAESFLTHRYLIYAGQVSFAVYLAHALVLQNLQHALGFSGWPADPVLIAATVAAAVALHHLVERPCEARLRGLRLPRRSVPVAESPYPVDG